MKIKENMTLGEILYNYPKAAEVLFKFGFHCIGCRMAASETLKQAAEVHKLSKKEYKELLEELNKIANSQ